MTQQKYKIVFNMALVALFSTFFLQNTMAQQKKEPQYDKLEIKMFPKAKEGFKQVYFQLPIEADENALKVEFFVGKNEMVDCNRYFMAGNIQEVTLEGWGYTYFTADTNGNIAGTLMGCPDNNKNNEFIHLQPQLVRYNSKLPIVIYVPQNCDVKYRIWRADKDLQNASLPQTTIVPTKNNSKSKTKHKH